MTLEEDMDTHADQESSRASQIDIEGSELAIGNQDEQAVSVSDIELQDYQMFVQSIRVGVAKLNKHAPKTLGLPQENTRYKESAQYEAEKKKSARSEVEKMKRGRSEKAPKSKRDHHSSYSSDHSTERGKPTRQFPASKAQRRSPSKPKSGKIKARHHSADSDQSVNF